MTAGDVRRRVERLEQCATAALPDALTIEEKATAIVQILVDEMGRAGLPQPATAAKLATKIPPPDGVDWDRWWRTLEEALIAAHEQ